MGSIIILFLIILSVLVFVHELGHFVVARRNGMRVDEFGFGFPPRLGGIVKDAKTGKWKFVWGGKLERSKNTIYSINWIPLGGFVKIKGEDGSGRDEEDSFASKSAWARIKVLAAGVTMNFALAWVIFAIVFMIGAPKAVEDEDRTGENPSVKIGRVAENSPAAAMGLQIGDEITKLSGNALTVPNIDKVSEVQKFITQNKGQEVTVTVLRGKELLDVQGMPRKEYPENEGSLGVELVRTAIVKYPIHEAVWQGLVGTYNLTIMILVAFGGMIKSLVATGTAPADIAGPVGIAYLTKQVADLGLVYVLQFAAVLSVNLGIINILPIPALDGGRIFFVLAEIIKGSPISKKFEQTTHAIGFSLLMLLMVVITFHDFSQFEILDKIKGLF